MSSDADKLPCDCCTRNKQAQGQTVGSDSGQCSNGTNPADHMDDILDMDLQIRMNLYKHIKILYSILASFILLMLLGVWQFNNELDSIKAATQKFGSLDFTKRDSKLGGNVLYGDFINASDILQNLDQYNLMLVPVKTRTKRSKIHSRKKREEHLVSLLTTSLLKDRHRRDNVEASLHQYCTAIHSMCESPSPPGAPGPSYIPGPPGPKGDKGSIGEKGTAGHHGYDGIAGTPGSKGKQGPKGDRGLVGFSGDKGERGYSGRKGETGEPGLVGDNGPEGPPGSKGSRGPQGPQGKIGRPGQRGQGEKGDRGARGTDGIPGVPGLKGIQGDNGPPGYGLNCVCEKGERGQRGLVGFAGYKGEPGDKGDRGAKGDRGINGRGKLGPVGPPGMKGAKGQKGDCDLCQKKKQNLVNMNRDETIPRNRGVQNPRYNEVPQQDHQALDSENQSFTTGTRGSRSSGTNSNNSATTLMTSLILLAGVFASVHVPLHAYYGFGIC